MDFLRKKAISNNNEAVQFLKNGKYQYALALLRHALQCMKKTCCPNPNHSHTKIAGIHGANEGNLGPVFDSVHYPSYDALELGQAKSASSAKTISDDISYNQGNRLIVEVISSEYDPIAVNIRMIPNVTAFSLSEFAATASVKVFPMYIDFVEFDSDESSKEMTTSFQCAVIMYNLGIAYICLQHQVEEEYISSQTKAANAQLYSDILVELHKNSTAMLSLVMLSLKSMCQVMTGTDLSMPLSYFDINRLLYFEIFLQYHLMMVTAGWNPLECRIHELFMAKSQQWLLTREQILPTPGSYFARMA